MGKDSKDSNWMWQIRNNVRKNNFKAVAETVKNIMFMDNDNPEKKQLMNKIYRDVIEPWVRGQNVEHEVPRQYEEMFIDFARQLDENSEQEKILDMLKRIENSKNPKTQKKVKRQLNLMGLAQELLKGSDIDTEAIEKYADELEKEADGATYQEIISKLFGEEFPVEFLTIENLKKGLEEKGCRPRQDPVTPGEKKEYPDEIKVDKRVKFLRDDLDTESKGRFAETGPFSGSMLLGIKDSDMVIVERLFEIYEDGTFDLANQPSGKASSTYILPKDKILEMIKSETKKQVRKELEKETEDEGLGIWKPIRHTRTWMDRVKNRIEQAKAIQQGESIEPSELDEEEDLEDTLPNTTTPTQKDETEVVLPNDEEKATHIEDEIAEPNELDNEDLSTEELEEQLKMLKEQNKKKEANLRRQQLLAQIRQEQQKGKSLDKQIEDAKRNIDIGDN